MSIKIGIVFKNNEQNNNVFYNIQVTYDEWDECDCVDDLLDTLKTSWNTTEKLKSLLPLGDISELGETLEETVSEVDKSSTKCRYKNGKLETIKYEVDQVEETGDGYRYYFKNTSIPLFIEKHFSETLEEIIKDSVNYGYEWNDIIYFNGKNFELIDL